MVTTNKPKYPTNNINALKEKVSQSSDLRRST